MCGSDSLRHGTGARWTGPALIQIKATLIGRDSEIVRVSTTAPASPAVGSVYGRVLEQNSVDADERPHPARRTDCLSGHRRSGLAGDGGRRGRRLRLCRVDVSGGRRATWTSQGDAMMQRPGPSRRALLKGRLTSRRTTDAQPSHISSAVVSVLPNRREEVLERLSALTDVEIHHVESF